MDCLWCVCGLIPFLPLMCYATVIDVFSFNSIVFVFQGYGLLVVCLWVDYCSGVDVSCKGH